VLSSKAADPQKPADSVVNPQSRLLLNCSFGELCRVGFALSWPVAGVLLLGFAVLIALRYYR
jgi:hypothetical protein